MALWFEDKAGLLSIPWLFLVFFSILSFPWTLFSCPAKIFCTQKRRRPQLCTLGRRFPLANTPGGSSFQFYSNQFLIDTASAQNEGLKYGFHYNSFSNVFPFWNFITITRAGTFRFSRLVLIRHRNSRQTKRVGLSSEVEKDYNNDECQISAVKFL